MSSARRESQKCTSLWIHCNRCFENYTNKQKTIYVLSCYHILCEKCVAIGKNNAFKCSLCNNIVKGYPIGNNLMKNLKDLFHPRPWTLDYNKALCVMKFQTKQRDSFNLGCKKLLEFKQSLERQRDLMKGQCREIYMLQKKRNNEKLKLHAALKRLKEARKSKQFAFQNLLSNRPREMSNMDIFGMQRQNKSSTILPSTCHMMSTSRNEDSFDFPPDNSLSKSFYL